MFIKCLSSINGQCFVAMLHNQRVAFLCGFGQLNARTPMIPMILSGSSGERPSDVFGTRWPDTSWTSSDPAGEWLR
jgi:hypothetical protein